MLYVGIAKSEKRVVFELPPEDSPEKDQARFRYVFGPFRTDAAARYFANFGRSNPFCTSVEDAERIVFAMERNAARKYGYRVHLGCKEDDGLNGRHWWTLARPGWSSVEVSHEDFDSEDEAWADAIRACHEERKSELTQEA